MTTDLDPATDLSFTRTLAVPRQLVWECWTQPRHIPSLVQPARVDVSVDLGARRGV